MAVRTLVHTKPTDTRLGADMEGSRPPGSFGSIAYLTGEYPKVSHTFIQREIAALRADGNSILSCTVRRARQKDVVGSEQKTEAANTFCILDSARNPLFLVFALVDAFGRSPRNWFRTVFLAWKTRSPGLTALIWQLFYFIEASIFARYLRQTGAGHIHNHFEGSSCSVAMLASALTGLPYSFTVHGPDIFFEAKRWRLDEKVARARFVVCISDFARSQVMLFTEIKYWDKLTIVHCGVDPSRYGPRKNKTYGGNILFVGRLTAVKGLPILLEAVGRVKNNHPNIKLTVVGDGPDRFTLHQHVKDLDLIDNVLFAGYQSQSDVANLLKEGDALVLPSFAEGVPVVLMEAMATYLPVIASQVGGVAELVKDQVSGYLVPPGNVEVLASRLDMLLTHPDLCESFGAAGREMVSAEFSIERSVAQLSNLFAKYR